jgi:hypothetical protein
MRIQDRIKISLISNHEFANHYNNKEWKEAAKSLYPDMDDKEIMDCAILLKYLVLDKGFKRDNEEYNK